MISDCCTCLDDTTAVIELQDSSLNRLRRAVYISPASPLTAGSLMSWL